LTQAIVEQHGATLELISKVGVGTTARVHFPASRLEEEPPAPLRTAVG